MMRFPKVTRYAIGLMATVTSGFAQSATHDAPPPGAPAAERPNVLLIMIDDLKPTLHSFGDTTAISPNIDRLAARGTRFEHAYANQAVCAPSRINLMTGRRSTSTACRSTRGCGSGPCRGTGAARRRR